MEQKQKKGKSRKKLGLLGALMGLLAITGGMFAYTYTTASVTIGVTATGVDYATVEPHAPPTISQLWGKHRGDLPTDDIFKINPEASYTGDLLVKVYLTNADELSKVYQHLNMKLQLVDKAGNVKFSTVPGHEFQLLTLDNGVVTMEMYGYNPGVDTPWYVRLVGGSYATNPWSPRAWGAGTYTDDPLLYCEVTQR